MYPINGLEEQRAIVGPIEVDRVVTTAMKRDRFRARCWVGYEHGWASQLQKLLDNFLARIDVVRIESWDAGVIVVGLISRWDTAVNLKAGNTYALGNEPGELIKIADEIAPTNHLLPGTNKVPNEIKSGERFRGCFEVPIRCEPLH